MTKQEKEQLNTKVSSNAAARVTLRVSEWLKGVIDEEAARYGLSQNTYLIKAVIESIAEDRRQRVGTLAHALVETVDSSEFEDLNINVKLLTLLSDMHNARSNYMDIMTTTPEGTATSELDMLELLESHYNKLLYDRSRDGDYPNEMREMIENRSSILIGGNTGAGKTTYMNKLRELILMDDKVNHVVEIYHSVTERPDFVHSKRVTSITGDTDPKTLDLLRKMGTPDYVIVDEVRTQAEANFVYEMAFKCPVVFNIHGSSLDSAKFHFKNLVSMHRDSLIDVDVFDHCVYIKKDHDPVYE